MFNILLFIFVGVSITNIVVNAGILDNPRNFISKVSFFEKLITCMMCSGFWIGLIVSCFFGVNPIIGAAIISLISSTYGTIMEYLEIVIALKAIELQDKGN